MTHRHFTNEDVVRLYNDGWSTGRIASHFNVSQACIHRRLRILGALDPNRGRGANLPATLVGKRGPLNHNWQGGKRKTGRGYVSIYRPDHPAANDRYVLEHRLVMEEHLGRMLFRHETVHHINGDRTDNRLENLQLRSGRHGKGVALLCGDCGSRNVVPAPIVDGPDTR